MVKYQVKGGFDSIMNVPLAILIIALAFWQLRQEKEHNVRNPLLGEQYADS